MNLLEEMMKEKEIPYIIVDGKYTLFSSNGFPVLNIEIKDNYYLIRTVNLNIDDKDEDHFKHARRCYNIRYSLDRLYDRLYDIYLWHAMDFN